MADPHNSGQRPKYDDNYIKELRSVTKLQDMMAETGKIIPHLNRGDREPGQDGYLFVLAEDNQYSIGRFIVQVKYFNSNLKDRIYHDFEVEQLRYYASEDSPFLLILVDVSTPKAYWRYVYPEWVNGLDINGKKKKRVPFQEENIIMYEEDTNAENGIKYVNEFRDILRKHRSIYAAERVKKTKEVMQELLNDGQYEQAIHKLRLEVDDASRSVCRARNIQFSHYSKLRGSLKLNGILTSDGEEDIYFRLYQSIVDADEGLSQVDDEQNARYLTEKGVELLEYLYKQQADSEFYR